VILTPHVFPHPVPHATSFLREPASSNTTATGSGFWPLRPPRCRQGQFTRAAESEEGAPARRVPGLFSRWGSVDSACNGQHDG